MFEKIKANLVFNRLMRRPNIDNAYKMVGPEDSWYDTITKVHNSLAEIKQNTHEILQISSHDDLTLKAIYYPCEGSDKTAIWVHGYTSHAERESAFPMLFYRSLGYNVLIPYLRAHGISEGKYIAFGALESLDMEAWVELINKKHPNGHIVIHGLSMGGGIALDVASKELKNVKCLVIDAPSYSISGFFAGVAEHISPKTHEKVFHHLCQRFRKEFGADPMAFDRVENIKQCRYPLLLSAGSMEEQEEILKRIKENNPMDSTILILPGCNHGNGMYKQTEKYKGAIRAFLSKYC